MTLVRRLVPSLVALALLAGADAAPAQQRQLLGTRVRITAPTVVPEKVTGNVTVYDSARLVVHDSIRGVDQAFPLHSILLMEISRGVSRRGSGNSRAGLMAFVVGGIGAIVGAVAHPAKSVGVSAGLGGLGGAVLGGAIGAGWGASTPRERWEWSVRPFGYDPQRAAADSAAVAPPPAPEPPPAPAPAPPPPPQPRG